MTRRIHKNTDCLNINLAKHTIMLCVDFKAIFSEKISRIFGLDKLTLNLLKICMGMRKYLNNVFFSLLKS